MDSGREFPVTHFDTQHKCRILSADDIFCRLLTDDVIFCRMTSANFRLVEQVLEITLEVSTSCAGTQDSEKIASKNSLKRYFF